MKRLVTALGFVVVIWLVAGIAMHFARKSAPSPEAVAQFIETSQFSDAPERLRERSLREVATRMSRLDWDERRVLRRSPAFREFTTSMSESEMGLFLDLTLPEGFRQMMMALNRMTPERRKQVVDRALADIESAESEAPGDAVRDADPHARKIIAEGMTAFYEDASVDVKLDFAPVLERIQRNLR